ncbi:hypothetical protein HYS10_00930 [Candidatus Collierbacteria bacterium]|nr:hypothetical protein [Candidatus Collierbacteria bacterium]
MLRPGFFPMHDDLQVIRIQQMSECLKDFQIPCRWVPDMGYGYGYPQFNYYGPLPYYLMTAANALGLNLFDSVKLGFILAQVLGNITMFFLVSSLWGNLAGFISAAAFAYTPYRASDLFVRGAMGEAWAFVFFPLILYAVKRIVEKPGLKSAALLALSIGSLLATHNISVLIFMPLAALWGIYWLLFQNKKLIVIKYAVLGFFWAVAIAGFFFLPVVFEQKFAHTETLLYGYFNYLAHFATIKQLFLTTFWGYGSSEIGGTDDIGLFLGPIHLFLGLTSLIIAIIHLRKKELRQHSTLILLSLLFILFSLFMTHSRSTFIWKLIPPLAFLQFPWRFLVTASTFLALISGFFVFKLGNKLGYYLAAIAVLFLFLFNRSFWKSRVWLDITPIEKLSGYSWDRQLTISIFDYLPIYAKAPPAGPAPVLPQVIEGKVGLTNYQKNLIEFLSVPKATNPPW